MLLKILDVVSIILPRESWISNKHHQGFNNTTEDEKSTYLCVRVRLVVVLQITIVGLGRARARVDGVHDDPTKPARDRSRREIHARQKFSMVKWRLI